MAKTNVKVNKREKDSPVVLLNKFKRKVQESGVIQKARSHRYSDRVNSKAKIKKDKLRRLIKTTNYEEMKRLGKLVKRK